MIEYIIPVKEKEIDEEEKQWLKEQGATELIRCKDCKWYDRQVSLCDNCGLPREQTFFCADGECKEGR